MTGIGANASSVSCHELTAKTAPTRTMLTTRPMIGGRPDVEEALELVDVVVEHREGPAGRAGLVPADVQGLHVPVRLDPQVVLDGLGQPAPQHLRGVVARRLEHPDHDVERRRASRAGRGGSSTPMTSATNEASPRTTTSMAAPMMSSGMTSMTLLTTDMVTAATRRGR